jgi:protease-4
MAEGRSRHPIVSIFMILAVCFLAFLGFWAFIIWQLGHFSGDFSMGGPGGGWSGNVAVVEIEGAIMDAKKEVKMIREIEKKDSIKGVVVYVNSPGGAPAPSQEIYRALKKLDEIKPVVASLGTVAASGGYWVALGARKIVSNPGTVTGSIGVLMEMANLEKLLEWAKVERYLLKAGKYKDIGSPFKPLGDEERKILKSSLDDIHRQFKEAVSAGRDLPMQIVDVLADGRPYTGRQALESKLVDQMGGLYDAAELVKKEAGFTEEVELAYPPKKMRFDIESFISEASSSAAKAFAEELYPRFR